MFRLSWAENQLWNVIFSTTLAHSVVMVKPKEKEERITYNTSLTRAERSLFSLLLNVVDGKRGVLVDERESVEEGDRGKDREGDRERERGREREIVRGRECVMCLVVLVSEWVRKEDVCGERMEVVVVKGASLFCLDWFSPLSNLPPSSSHFSLLGMLD